MLYIRQYLPLNIHVCRNFALIWRLFVNGCYRNLQNITGKWSGHTAGPLQLLALLFPRSVSECPSTNTQRCFCFFPCQLFSSWLYVWSKIASPGATASEHVGILKRSKMGCGQGCSLSPMFNFQRDHHGKQMTMQKRFPDLTERASEIEQGLKQTYIDTTKIHYTLVCIHL